MGVYWRRERPEYAAALSQIPAIFLRGLAAMAYRERDQATAARTARRARDPVTDRNHGRQRAIDVLPGPVLDPIPEEPDCDASVPTSNDSLRQPSGGHQPELVSTTVSRCQDSNETTLAIANDSPRELGSDDESEQAANDAELARAPSRANDADLAGAPTRPSRAVKSCEALKKSWCTVLGVLVLCFILGYEIYRSSCAFEEARRGVDRSVNQCYWSNLANFSLPYTSDNMDVFSSRGSNGTFLNQAIIEDLLFGSMDRGGEEPLKPLFVVSAGSAGSFGRVLAAMFFSDVTMWIFMLLLLLCIWSNLPRAAFGSELWIVDRSGNAVRVQWSEVCMLVARLLVLVAVLEWLIFTMVFSRQKPRRHGSVIFV
ncbi:hypothetical protein HPB50_004856 [Hyalomma asiaticum]|uniref:Uncharacterized protein n=1 Tax=Hyalomma asiaticum TaxID=266040 RepID=A0ACB7SC92_HYAAI|nr:hypothetical protein HPB50_004856 [Hyalomma asiaticum]